MIELQVENSKRSTDAGNGPNRESPPPDPADFAVECFSAAEEYAEKVLTWVQPTLDSEEKRGDVIDYIQRLVKNRLGCEVISYGSVPLRTYLPEGDIDLTVLKGPNIKESWIHDILTVIQEQERNANAEYDVRETQYIDAEVKLVKCLIGNIVIDISFHQLGGLSTLCFLEQVDRYIGRNHLFKRSIILVKAWCYYESRILGAHHGLISTYALETLVLCILHFFHSSLIGPLSVLHKFLDYYGQFDWENYCISLRGPIRKSALPDILVDMPKNISNTQLLTDEFLKSCSEMFSGCCGEIKANSKPFQIKNLNVVDPLKENNNLGRSVNRGNFYRIRTALKYGSSKLNQILSQCVEVEDAISCFFANTRERHGSRNRSIIRRMNADVGKKESSTTYISSPAVLSSDDEFFKSCGCNLAAKDSTFLDQEPISVLSGEEKRLGVEMGHVGISSESSSADEIPISVGDMEGNGTSNSSLCGGADAVSSSNSLYSSKNGFYGTSVCVENASVESDPADSSYFSRKFHFTSWLDNRNGFVETNNPCGFLEEHSESTCTSDSSSVTKFLDTLDCREIDSISTDEESEVLDAPADLNGDYDGHIRNFLRAQLCHAHASSMPIARSTSSSSPCRNRFVKPWDKFCRSMTLSRTNSRVISLSHSMSAKVFDYDSAFSRVNAQFEKNKRTPGIGTYFPKMNEAYMETWSHGRGRNKFAGCRRPLFGYKHSKNTENAQLIIEPGLITREIRKQKTDEECKCLKTTGSCSIEFGSLTEEMISGLSAGGSTSQPVKERFETDKNCFFC